MNKKLLNYILIILITLLAFLLSSSGMALAQPLAQGEDNLEPCCPPPRGPAPGGPPPCGPPACGPPPCGPPPCGCPIPSICEIPGPDADGDGVPDWLDKCPDTDPKYEVDKYGCMIAIPTSTVPEPDEDGDLVHDPYDRCPGTPNRPVDTVGCPTDKMGGYTYIVAPGDWWYKISRRSGICLKRLLEANTDHLYPCCRLYSGIKLTIPSK